MGLAILSERRNGLHALPHGARGRMADGWRRVTPAKAGVQFFGAPRHWIPACAGMTPGQAGR